MIRYFGHSTVLFDKLVIDPHDGGSIGLLRPNYGEAKYVIITHDHYDHNAFQLINYQDMKVAYTGSMDLGDFKVEGYSTFHDKEKGKRRGKNTIYRIIRKSDNFSMVHLGDLGHLLNEDILKQIKKPDLLAIPVGGLITINYNEASQLIDELEPSSVLPIHYWIKGHYMPLDPVDEFIEKIKAKYEPASIEISKNEDLEKIGKGKVFYIKA
ncbi:MBL fold metallo-hydrolase [Sulfuracidifex metallicus]|uniref:MBL fold metallo-hydrolase n=1 Tax=Sulfuracidifex metallicus TaxID=47303 RepID=UPI00227258B5|nr:MBL fold metallo-hydrolase [Sulfuracidifex metallicus]MCY0850413.1 MBL fold metallo-hydrolase [Sulfuracidifex metallicus]